jgi:tRNA nucleotidyltransferase (CCA-adding enzyme)
MSTTPKLSGFRPDPVLENLPATVQLYVVGGAVRDELLGIPSADRDWVVVGATAGQMLDAGFRPVGADFPVFLHPETQEEYALARTERKSGHGYKGFVFHADPSVRLEDDLARRDFTINAMAMNAQGKLFDPHGGLADLKARQMRHVSPAFVEDPLRVLRLARFLARFHDFSVADETMVLCGQLQQSGELTHLVAERVFAELNKGMDESQPSRMLALLSRLHAWESLGGEPARCFSRLDHAVLAQLDALGSTSDRWVFLLSLLMVRNSVNELTQRWRVPKDIQQAVFVYLELTSFLQSPSVDEADCLGLFERVDVFRKPERLALVYRLCEEIYHHPLSQHLQRSGSQQQARARIGRIIQNALEQVQQGHFKHHVAQAIQQAEAGLPVPDVVASARWGWVAALLEQAA